MDTSFHKFSHLPLHPILASGIAPRKHRAGLLNAPEADTPDVVMLTPPQPTVVTTTTAPINNKKRQEADQRTAIGIAAGTGLTAATWVYGRQILAANKQLEKRHTKFITNLGSLEPYKKHEYAQVLQKSNEVLTQLKDPKKGDAWLKARPETKFFLDTLVDKTPANVEKMYQSFKKQLILEALDVKYGKYNKILTDLDGTHKHKDFNNITAGMEENEAANQVLLQTTELSTRAKMKFAIQYGSENANDTKLQLPIMVNEMKALGLFGEAVEGKDGMWQLTDKKSEVILTQWVKNTMDSFKTLKGKALEEAISGSCMALVTARAGGNGTVFEAVTPNHVFGFGLGEKNYQSRPFAGAAGVYKMKSALVNTNVDTFGIGGAYIIDGQQVCPLAFADSALSGLPEKLIKAGMLDIIYKSTDSPLRQVEPKGVLTGLMKGIMSQHLEREAAKIEAGTNTDGITLETIMAGLIDPLRKSLEKDTSTDQDEKDKLLGKAEATYRQQWQDAGKKAGEPTKATLLNRYYMNTGTKPAFAMPIAWEAKLDEVMEKVMLSATLIAKGKTAEIPEGYPKTMVEIAQHIQKNTRRLDEADFNYLNTPFLEATNEGLDGTAGEWRFGNSQKRANFAKSEAEKVLKKDENFKLPVGKTQYEQIQALANKGENITLADIQQLHRDFKTVDMACLTVHTIEAELNGVFAEFFKIQAQNRKDEKLPIPNMREMVLESQKWDLLKRIIALENNEELKAELQKQGFAGILKVSSADASLCYPSKEEIDKGGKYLINMVNNSSGIRVIDYLEAEGFAPEQIEKIVKSSNLVRFADPTGSYVESVLNIALDKGAVLPFINNLLEHPAFQGDSIGTDRLSICYLLSLSPFHNSEVVRNMITDQQVLDGLFENLNINKGTAKGLREAYEKQFKANGFSQETIDNLFAQFEEQLKANPLRYKEVSDVPAGNDVKTGKYLQLIGHGHEALISEITKQSDTKKMFWSLTDDRFVIHEDDYKALLKDVYGGLFMGRLIRSNDVPISSTLAATASAILHNDAWNTNFDTLSELWSNHYLAQKGMLSEQGQAFFRHDPFAFALGMPLEAAFADAKMMPDNLKKNIGNVAAMEKEASAYAMSHIFTLNIGRNYLNMHEIGGWMAAAGGIGALGVGLFQAVSAWNKPAPKVVAQPQQPTPTATQSSHTLSVETTTVASPDAVNTPPEQASSPTHAAVSPRKSTATVLEQLTSSLSTLHKLSSPSSLSQKDSKRRVVNVQPTQHAPNTNATVAFSIQG